MIQEDYDPTDEWFDERERYNEDPDDRDDEPTPSVSEERLLELASASAASGLVVITNEDAEAAPDVLAATIYRKCEQLQEGLLKALGLSVGPPSVAPFSQTVKMVSEAYDKAQRERIISLETQNFELSRRIKDPRWLAVYHVLRRDGVIDRYREEDAFNLTDTIVKGVDGVEGFLL